MAKIKIKQTRSLIGRNVRQKKTIEALGLKRMNHQIEVENNPAIVGMINKVQHLITIIE